MCGIFAYQCSNNSSLDNEAPFSDLVDAITTIQHRGPDQTSVLKYSDQVVLGFHRLAINDLTTQGNQPLTLDGLTLVCNGEIYNWKELSEKYHFQLKSKSDCEVILHLYKAFGIEETCKLLDGYFAFVLMDGDTMYVARDPIGIRSLFYTRGSEAKSGGNSMVVASELKAIHTFGKCNQFPGGTWWSSVNPDQFTSYVTLSTILYDSYTTARTTIRSLLERAVEKRVLTTERPIGCLLSGGLDSSVISALVAKYYKTYFPDRLLHTFSIGFEGSTDCAYARKVADHIGSVHHEVIVTEKEMLDAIPHVIRMIESYDTTTVRASTPMYLLCKYIATQTDIKVIFSGEGSDELSGSYLYFYHAPSDQAFADETKRLVKDLSYFDVLRCDKSTATNGLEVRVPFLDKDFVEYYLNLEASLKNPTQFNCEKYLLRDACEDLLPNEVTWRTKEAFSDGVSKKEKSWFTVIQDHVNTLELNDKEYSINPPALKETRWYRQIYEEAYPDQEHLIPYYWLPRWTGNTQDPSARVLEVYDRK